jgi:hypothetical protein
VLLVMMGAMYGLASTYYRRVRGAAGLPIPGRAARSAEGGGSSRPGDLETLLRSPRPWVIVWVGIAGLVVILWLMVFKPF